MFPVLFIILTFMVIFIWWSLRKCYSSFARNVKSKVDYLKGEDECEKLEQ